jgi:hypothetical protein
MLLAPFTIVDTSRTVRPQAARSRSVPSWLLIWAGSGLLVLGLVPSLAIQPQSGMTVPFWLVGAPLLDIAWLTRTHWLNALRKRLGSLCGRHRRQHQARRETGGAARLAR